MQPWPETQIVKAMHYNLCTLADMYLLHSLYDLVFVLVSGIDQMHV